MLNFNDIIWKNVVSNPNYEVSNIGEIRSKERYVKNSANTKRLVKTRIKKQFINNGYAYIQLYINDVRTVMAIHRLVAEAFINNPDNKPMVNHLNGNKLKNNVCNLEWCTCIENIHHANRNNLSAKGERVWLSKLTESEVIEIRGLYSHGDQSHHKLAKKFNVSHGNIYKILNRTTWKHV